MYWRMKLQCGVWTEGSETTTECSKIHEQNTTYSTTLARNYIMAENCMIDVSLRKRSGLCLYNATDKVNWKVCGREMSCSNCGTDLEYS
jgi:hypothetical protein